MNYTVYGQLMRVMFPDYPIPNDPHLAMAFPGREAFFQEDKWVGVVCSQAEWKDFLDAMEELLSEIQGGESALIVIRFFRGEFVKFLTSTAHGMIRLGSEKCVDA